MLRPDARDMREAFDFELVRLRRLGVRLKKIGKQPTREHITRFASEFVDPERSAHFLLASTMGPVDHVKWVRSDCSQDAPRHGVLEWLSAGSPQCACLRLDRRPGLPAVELRLETLNESWVSSWPGVYVRFVAGRALVVTLDYEVFQCDVRSGRGSPYR